MKAQTSLILIALTTLGFSQIPGLGGGAQIPGVDQLFRKGPAITTSLPDCKWEAKDFNESVPTAGDLFTLESQNQAGWVLREGSWTGTVASYCLKAGTHGPGGGDGYLYAPPRGPYENAVISIAQNSVKETSIPQSTVQTLLWALIARTKFLDLPRELQAAAAKLLTTKQLSDLNGGALGILTDERLGGAIIKEPPIVRQVMEAENRLRRLLVNPASSFRELEAIAVLTGEVPWGAGSREIPSGRWSLHPDGYYVKYMPQGYSTTDVTVFVPKGSKAIGKVFDPAKHIAVPGNTNRQRLLMSMRKK